MRRYSINDVASVITEDPDIIVELDAAMDAPMDAGGGEDKAAAAAAAAPEKDEDASVTEPEVGSEKPLTAVEVEKQAEDVAGEDPDAEVADQIKAQEEAQKQMDLERQKLLEPQMTELHNSMDALGTGITQGVASAQTGGEAFTNLDQQMASINAILAQLEKQLY